MNKEVFKVFLIIDLAVTIITLLIWLPHLLAIKSFFNLDFSNGFNTIYRNFDGLEYVIIAKSFYNPNLIANLPQSLPATYYASHFPLYSIFILAAAQFLGFLKSMLFIPFIFTLFSAKAFYFLVRDFKLSSHPLWLTLLFLVLPARWLIVHSVGSSEPMFIFFIITAIYCFMKFEQSRKWLWIYLTGLSGLFAQLTRPPGILLFIALGIYILWSVIASHVHLLNVTWQSNIKRVLPYYPLLLIPLGLFTVFYWFGISYHDFWAYFHSGDNIHLTLPPFQVFDKHAFWVGEIWLEDIVYIFILGFFGGIYLLKQKLYPMAFFVLIYIVASIMVVHRDISRYTLPIFPFLLIAFERILTSKEFKIAFVIVALGIYLYAQNFILENVAPIPNLGVFN
ncbi:glycosyltransferase family 39 protein [Candidatus Daviesbacteria bacterium]|nr:glycosyltransferase family 39 protein [Candidatus Daviesbacteria bacterium]